MTRKQIVIVLNFLVRFIKNDKALDREGVHQVPLSTITKFVRRSSLLPDPDTVLDWMVEHFLSAYGYKDVKINKMKFRLFCLKYDISVAPANANIKAVKKLRQQKRDEINSVLREHKKNVQMAQENLNRAIDRQAKEAKRLEEANDKGFNRAVLRSREIATAEANFIKSINESMT